MLLPSLGCLRWLLFSKFLSKKMKVREVKLREISFWSTAETSWFFCSTHWAVHIYINDTCIVHKTEYDQVNICATSFVWKQSPIWYQLLKSKTRVSSRTALSHKQKMSPCHHLSCSYWGQIREQYLKTRNIEVKLFGEKVLVHFWRQWSMVPLSVLTFIRCFLVKIGIGISSWHSAHPHETKNLGENTPQ